MEPDLLKVKIEKARKELPSESVEAVDSINWKPLVASMNTKYNPEQIEVLTLETELLLCGLSNPGNYQRELELQMRISKNEADILLSEMDKLIFKKIQNELEKIIVRENNIRKSKQNIPDQKFSNIPKEVQNAVANSNWKETLYSLSKKYKLPIDKMGALEELTAKVINGEIKTDKFESELKTNLGLPEDGNHSLVEDINNQILKTIKESLKENWGDDKKIIEDTIPLPPYLPQAIKISATEKTSIEMEPTTEEKNGNVDIYKNSGIELLGEEESEPSLKDIETIAPKNTPVISFETKPLILNEKGEEDKIISEYKQPEIKTSTEFITPETTPIVSIKIAPPEIKTKETLIIPPIETPTETKEEIKPEVKTIENIIPTAPAVENIQEIKQPIIETPLIITPKLTPIAKTEERSSIAIPITENNGAKVTPDVELIKEIPVEMPTKINMLQMKLNNHIASESTISDYSLTKINNKTDQVPVPPVGYSKTPHDIYHEEI